MCFEPICTNLKEINISMVLKIMQWWLNSVFTLFRILWKSKCHVLVTFPIQLKKLCSIYTLEHRIELWIFHSLNSKNEHTKRQFFWSTFFEFQLTTKKYVAMHMHYMVVHNHIHHSNILLRLLLYMIFKKMMQQIVRF